MHTLFLSGRFGRADGDPAAGQAVAAGGCHLLGNRLCGAQPAGSLHEDIRVQRLDQPDPAVLAYLEHRTLEDIPGSGVPVAFEVRTSTSASSWLHHCRETFNAACLTFHYISIDCEQWCNWFGLFKSWRIQHDKCFIINSSNGIFFEWSISKEAKAKVMYDVVAYEQFTKFYLNEYWSKRKLLCVYIKSVHITCMISVNHKLLGI